ncbi:MAG: polyprenyl synthetase family protein [Alphaproteobacteria bacterium]|nr:polyprenyl synthetase family protein [Alphaproteobacteria bacterium]
MNTATAQTASAPSTASMDALRQLTAADLQRVNAVILENVKSDITLISDLASHIVSAGGKRIRPSLTIAAAQLMGYSGTRHVQLAACVEFIHTATLLHDDVVDDSHLRRGEETANAIWGNKSSVLVGDFLLSRAFQLMVADGGLDVLKILSDASATIAAGEVKQLMVSHDLSIEKEVYLEVIAAKTAALFEAACELGAVVSDQPSHRENMRGFGHALGMAFQLIDDALDYTAQEAELGKAIGDDFRDGKVTLPVIVAYQASTPEEQAFWQRCFDGESEAQHDDLVRAKQLIQHYGGIDATFALARDYAAKAHALLEPFKPSPIRDALHDAVDFCINRSF